jgi:transcriptional repressor NrdR
MTERRIAKLACPYCEHPRSKVTNSRPATRRDGVWRRRECLSCGKRFTTEETIRGVYRAAS